MISLSYVDNFDNDFMFGLSVVIYKVWYYLQGENLINLCVFFFWGDFLFLCLFLLVVGSIEVMLGDIVRFVEKVIEYGGMVEIIVEKEVLYVFFLYLNLLEVY